MRVTVIVCTYNRCADLANALDSLAVSAVPESTEWDVLVVDNNSSDETRKVVEGFCLRYPSRFRYLSEPRQGKSQALNTGIAQAHGDVLAFTDDDVIVEPAWLQNLTAALDGTEWVGSAGRILPARAFSVPRWLSLEGRYALAPLALFDLGTQAGPLAESPFGANMAFQKKMFEEYGGFRTDLGPRPGGKDPQKSEDSEFGHRLLEAGQRLRYEPSAIVHHAIPPSRVKKKYFLNWWFDKARADIQAFGTPRESKWHVGGVPLYLFRRLVVWALRWMTTLEPSRRFSCKIKVWVLCGEILECHRQSRHKITLTTVKES